jgi:hypothetical protein
MEKIKKEKQKTRQEIADSISRLNAQLIEYKGNRQATLSIELMIKKFEKMLKKC